MRHVSVAIDTGLAARFHGSMIAAHCPFPGGELHSFDLVAVAAFL